MPIKATEGIASKIAHSKNLQHIRGHTSCYETSANLKFFGCTRKNSTQLREILPVPVICPVLVRYCVIRDAEGRVTLQFRYTITLQKACFYNKYSGFPH